MSFPSRRDAPNIIRLDTVDSTNAYAASHRDLEEGTVIVAQEQTAGRGRLGRAWLSEKGQNLTFSVILRPEAPAEFAGVISLGAGLAVAETISSMTKLSPECKWPNDVLLGGKKVSGILSETIIRGGNLAAAIVGVGLNVNQVTFPEGLRATATSLSAETGHRHDTDLILLAFLDAFGKRYGEFRSRRYDVIINDWKARSRTIGRSLSVRTGMGEIRGLAKGIAPDGALLVDVDGLERKILAADIIEQ